MYDCAHGAVRLHRGHHALALHARVRGPPAAVRLVPRPPAGMPYHPQQIEFARLNLTYTVHEQAQAAASWCSEGTSPAGTTRACRPSAGCAGAATRPRRSATSATASAWPSATALVDVALLEHCRPRGPEPVAAARDGRAAAAEGRHRRTTPRARSRSSTRSTTPRTPAAGTRKVPFSRELYIERDDFREDAAAASSSAWPRAARCACATPTSSPATRWSRTTTGEVVELRCTYDPATRGGDAPDGRKVKGTLHWVSAPHAVAAEVRLYDHLFTAKTPATCRTAATSLDDLNPRLARGAGRRAGRAVAGATRAGDAVPVRAPRLLLRRPRPIGPARPVFNRTVTLRDTWAKIEKAQAM